MYLRYIFWYLSPWLEEANIFHQLQTFSFLFFFLFSFGVFSFAYSAKLNKTCPRAAGFEFRG